jgi:hypothetical protein
MVPFVAGILKRSSRDTAHLHPNLGALALSLPLRHGLHFRPLVAIPSCTRILLQYVQHRFHTRLARLICTFTGTHFWGPVRARTSQPSSARLSVTSYILGRQLGPSPRCHRRYKKG